MNLIFLPIPICSTRPKVYPKPPLVTVYTMTPFRAMYECLELELSFIFSQHMTVYSECWLLTRISENNKTTQSCPSVMWIILYMFSNAIVLTPPNQNDTNDMHVLLVYANLCCKVRSAAMTASETVYSDIVISVVWIQDVGG